MFKAKILEMIVRNNGEVDRKRASSSILSPPRYPLLVLTTSQSFQDKL